MQPAKTDMNVSNKKALITGADGFMGSHLVETMIEEGCSVKAFCYYNSFNSWGWLDSFDKAILREIEVFSGDIRDPNGLRTAMEGCDAGTTILRFARFGFR